jgi:hypothetical protein
MDAITRWAGCVLANMILPAALLAAFVVLLGIISAAFVGLCALSALTGPVTFAACLTEAVASLGLAALVVGGVLLAFMLAVFIWAAISCLFSTTAGVAGAAPTAVGQAISAGTPLDCPAAQALLAQAQAGLQAAQAARDAAADQADRARRRALNATAAVAAAVTAVLASIWCLPWQRSRLRSH